MSLQVLSYGGGVQSTCIILLAIDGKIKKPDLVIFANTGSELPSTYETVEAVSNLCSQNNIEFLTVYGNPEEFEEGVSLHEYYMQKPKPPFLPMVRNPQCTFKFKIYPVRRAIKKHRLFDSTKKKPWANTWLGITTDESHRKRKSDVKWIETSFPLLELDMSRKQCIEYISNNYPELEVSKSGCFCCPYASPKKYVDLKIEHPSLFEICVQMEKSAKERGQTSGLVAGKTIEAYNSTISLVDFGLKVPEDYECSSSQGGCFL